MNNLAGIDALSGDGVTAGYRLLAADSHDEMLDATGVVRPHWRALLSELESIPPDERRARAQALDKRVNQIGIAYDIFADPTAQRQRWTVDLAPLIIAPAEWRWLETALQQRARLFEAILAGSRRPQRDIDQAVEQAWCVSPQKTTLPSHQHCWTSHVERADWSQRARQPAADRSAIFQ